MPAAGRCRGDPASHAAARRPKRTWRNVATGRGCVDMPGLGASPRCPARSAPVGRRPNSQSPGAAVSRAVRLGAGSALVRRLAFSVVRSVALSVPRRTRSTSSARRSPCVSCALAGLSTACARSGKELQSSPEAVVDGIDSRSREHPLQPVRDRVEIPAQALAEAAMTAISWRKPSRSVPPSGDGA
jgi:hypothetical protein